MRFLFFIALIYLCYKAFKALLFPDRRAGREMPANKPEAIDDIMVKDPFCGVYFPKRDGVVVKRNGEKLYFCSTKCRDAFQDSQPGK